MSEREILIPSIVLGGVDRRDHPDYVDAYIEYAEWMDGTPLTEEELDAAQDEYGDIINELANEGHGRNERNKPQDGRPGNGKGGKP